MSEGGMADPYASIPEETFEYADVLVNYSGDVAEGDTVIISYDEPARDLALAVQKLSLEAGAHPVTDRRDSQFTRGFFYAAEGDQIEYVPESEKVEAEQADTFINIRSSLYETALADVPGEKRQKRRAAMQPVSEKIIDGADWVLAQYWTPGFAQKTNMSQDQLRDFVLDACVKNWEEESEAYKGLKEVVDAGEDVYIVDGEGRELEFSIGEQNGVNRVGLLSDGTNNVPGGEVFTAPIRESVNGEVYFELPAFVKGETVDGIYLEFEDGEVVDYSAESGEGVLDEIIGTDEGAKYLGELGIGTNFGVDKPMKDTLFDEKIGGTIHLALGRAYRGNFAPAIGPEDLDHDLTDNRVQSLIDTADKHLAADDTAEYNTFLHSLSNEERSIVSQYRELWEETQEEIGRQRNESVQHQDFVKDLRRDGGRLVIDGETILEEGSFVGVDSLP